MLSIKGISKYRSFRDYTNEELIRDLKNNITLDSEEMTGVLSEILRRMNEKSPIIPKKDETDWANPITP